MNETTLILLLRATATGEIIIALLATQMTRLLHWEEDVRA